MTGDVFGSLRCDGGDQLHVALRMIEADLELGFLADLRDYGISALALDLDSPLDSR